MDRAGINDHIDIAGQVGGFLPVKYMGIIFLQRFGKRRRLDIGTGYLETFFEKNLCQSAHANASDTDEIYVAGMIKIYFVHMNTSYSFLFLLKLLYAYSGYVNVWKR